MTVPLNIAKGLGQAFSALESSLATASNFSILLSRLGWNVQLTDEQMTVVNNAIGLAAALSNLVQSLNALNNGGDAAAVVESAGAVISALDALSDLSVNEIATLPVPLNDVNFWRDDFAPPLIDLIVTDLIRDKAVALHGFMDTFGLIEPRLVDGDRWWLSSPSRMRWDRLLPAAVDPVGHLKTIYGWNADLQADAIAAAISTLALELGLQAYPVPISDTLRARFFPDLSPEITIRATEVVLIETGISRAGLRILPVNTSAEKGLYVEPFVTGSAEATANPFPNVDLMLAAASETSGYGVFWKPGGRQEVIGTAADVDAEMRLIWKPDTPQILIGSTDGARLALIDGEVSVTFKGNPTEPEIILAVGGHDGGLQMVLNPDDADGFVNELISHLPLSGSLPTRFVWSSASGFAIEGSAALEMIFPLNIDLQVVTLTELYAALMIASESIDITCALTFTANVDPFTFTLKRIGLTTSFAPKGEPSSDNPTGIDIGLAFKPPSGAGIAFDFLGIVSGGGFIDMYPEKGEYNGIITVQFAVIGVTAIALIATKLPDNPGMWSMFVSINVNLGGIPLVFGFTLEKIGGLIGIHRAIDSDVFLEGVRTGLLDSILFHDDPIGDAPRILNDMQNAFPAAPGSFVIGAMLQIGWGAPTLITVDAGFIIQVPDIVLMLIGQCDVLLPDEDMPLVEIHFDVVAILDLTLGTLAINAGLRDSQIVGFTLTGEMALRANFLGQPSFLLAIGGFHPAFVPPDSFPKLARLGFGLSVGDWLSISLETYLAVSSNTVQFGAGLYLSAKLVGFRVEGGFEFNTLITFSPFSFRADMNFYITVSAGSIELLGVRLIGHLSGPNPYFVHGQAQFKFLGMQQEVNIEESIGGKTTLDEPDEIPVRTRVAAAFIEPENWRAVDDGSRIGAVLLAQNADPEGDIAIHPGGSVEAFQRVAPLDVELEHYGNAGISGEEHLVIANVEAGDSGIAWEFVEDWFAPAQYFDLERADKLDAPSFEMMKAGLRFGDDEADGGAIAATVYDYEEILHDPEFETSTLTLKKSYIPDQSILSVLNQQKRLTGSARPLINRSASQSIALNPVRYTLVKPETLAGNVVTSSETMTYAEANQRVQRRTRARIVVTIGERATE